MRLPRGRFIEIGLSGELPVEEIVAIRPPEVPKTGDSEVHPTSKVTFALHPMRPVRGPSDGKVGSVGGSPHTPARQLPDPLPDRPHNQVADVEEPISDTSDGEDSTADLLGGVSKEAGPASTDLKGKGRETTNTS